MNRFIWAFLFVVSVPAGAWIADSAFQPPKAQSFTAGGSGSGASVTYPVVNVQVGGYVSVTPTVTGGTPSSYSVTSGALPDGLSLNSSTGAITGAVTTTALRKGMTGSLGANPDLGEHTFTVTAAGVGVLAPVSINVYALAVPTPQSLFVGSSEFDSGTNFLDAIDGVTFTKTAGTQDTDLTDTTSPLGYSHKFDGNTYFQRASRPTVPSPVHLSMALFHRHVDMSTSTVQTYMELGGFPLGAAVVQRPSRFYIGNITDGATPYGYTTEDRTWTSVVAVSDEGVGYKNYISGVGESFAATGDMLVNQSGSYNIGDGELHAPPRYAGGYVAEAAYWPRVLDATQAASIDWAWFRGISLDDWDGLAPTSPTVTHTPTAPAYERPVTCTGSYTLTGSTTNAAEVTWLAMPDGATGTCTGTTSYSCAVAVSPNASGEGVETITISAIGADGEVNSIRRDVGFYVAGARDCFLSQSIDGLSNTTNADNDAVTTWVNLIDSSRNVTQSSAGAKPSVQEGVGSGVYVQPLVRFDGGDLLNDDVASDWNWLHNGTTAITVDVVAKPTGGIDSQAILSTTAGTGSCLSDTFVGVCLRPSYGPGLGGNHAIFAVKNTTGNALAVDTGVTASLADDKYQLLAATNDITTGTFYVDGTSLATAAAGTYTTNAASSPLRLGGGNTVHYLTGDLFRVILYQSALTSTQRGINKAVDEWALGNSLPVNP